MRVARAHSQNELERILDSTSRCLFYCANLSRKCRFLAKFSESIACVLLRQNGHICLLVNITNF